MSFKSILAIIVVIGLLSVGQTSGQQVSKPNKAESNTKSAQKKLTPEQKLKRIETEFQAELDKLQLEFRQAKTKDQRQAIEDRQPLPVGELPDGLDIF